MAKTGLITGANRGIGQQVARVLASDGWDVLVGSRDKAKGEAVWVFAPVPCKEGLAP